MSDKTKTKPPEPDEAPAEVAAVNVGQLVRAAGDPAGTHLLVVASDEDTVTVAPLETFQIRRDAVEQG